MKKKIVFVIESLQLGGAEKSLVTLLQNLDFDKYVVDLITFQENGFFKDFVPNEVNQIFLPFPRLSLFDRLQYLVKRKLKIKYHHAQLFWPLVSKYFTTCHSFYDVAIAYNQGFATYFVHDFIHASKKITWLNTDYQKAGYNAQFDVSYYAHFSKIIAVSPEAKDSLMKAFISIDKTLQIEIIKDISDKEIIIQKANDVQEILFDNNYINLVTVTRLVKAKGLNLLLESALILKEKGYSFKWYIVGEGSERRFLEQKIMELHLEKYVYLLGSTPNPYPYMKAADIYVQTSLFEGLGLTVIEASYLNKPIVCTNFPTAYGILKNQETGLICEMNADSISNSIEKLILNEDFKNKLILNLSKIECNDKQITLLSINNLF